VGIKDEINKDLENQINQPLQASYLDSVSPSRIPPISENLSILK
jgi:hypothetical protein